MARAIAARIGKYTRQGTRFTISPDEGIGRGEVCDSVPKKEGLGPGAGGERRRWVLGYGDAGAIGLRGPPAERVAEGRRSIVCRRWR